MAVASIEALGADRIAVDVVGVAFGEDRVAVLVAIAMREDRVARATRFPIGFEPIPFAGPSANGADTIAHTVVTPLGTNGRPATGSRAICRDGEPVATAGSLTEDAVAGRAGAQALDAWPGARVDALDRWIGVITREGWSGWSGRHAEDGGRRRERYGRCACAGSGHRRQEGASISRRDLV